LSAARHENVVGYEVFAGGVAACVDSIVQEIAVGGRMRWLACINPHSYAVALKLRPFEEALRDSDWLVPDGIGVVFASKMRGGAIRERVTGSDIFHGVHERLNARGGGRIFFIGSTEETLRRIREKMATDYPRLEVVGTYSPPFKAEYTSDELDHMVATINAARPDVLWVGMTAPKQESWIHQLRERLDVRFAAAIGAVFDFYIGRVKRSPAAFQVLGLEWLPRLVQEPRRLWRRTFVSAPIFMWHAATRRGRPMS
jgi:N-acetylglucosaminyldiphosphoundecaprenol N-acetyl-beta-D-mannosaminyltransferase